MRFIKKAKVRFLEKCSFQLAKEDRTFAIRSFERATRSSGDARLVVQIGGRWWTRRGRTGREIDAFRCRRGFDEEIEILLTFDGNQETETRRGTRLLTSG